MYGRIRAQLPAPTHDVRLGEVRTNPTSPISNVTNTRLVLQVQEMKGVIRFFLSALGQDGYHSFGTLPHHIRQAIRALEIDVSPTAVNGYSAGLYYGQPDVQAGIRAGTGDVATSIAPLLCNNAGGASGPEISSGAVDYPGNYSFNSDVNAGQHSDNFFGADQYWDASLMFSNGDNNGDSIFDILDFDVTSLGIQHDVESSATASTDLQMTSDLEVNNYGDDVVSLNDSLDVTAIYSPFDTGANAVNNIPGAIQGDVDNSAMVITPNITAPSSSTTEGARTSRARLYLCNGSMQCHKTFARRADRDRHALTHDKTSIRTLSCPFPGCDRVGISGFWRPDKFNEHRTKLRH